MAEVGIAEFYGRAKTGQRIVVDDLQSVPTTIEGWLDALDRYDDGTIESVAPFLREPILDEIDERGRLKRPFPPFRTPLGLARFMMAEDVRKEMPWRGTGLTPSQFREIYDAYMDEAEPPLPEITRTAGGVSDLYFIGSEGGPIKIGVSQSPAQRLKGLQTGYPYRLSILAIVKGGAHQEITYHARFAAHRLHGEWFERCPEIEAEITRLSPNTSEAARD